MLLMEYSSLVPPPPSFRKVPAGLSVPACKLPAISPLLSSSCPLHLPWLLPASVIYIFFPAPAQPLAPLASAGTGQKNTFPEPAQPRASNLRTAALKITPSAAAAQPGSVAVSTDNVPPTPTNPQPSFHGEAADVGSQAPLARSQTASRVAKANRAPVPVVPSFLPHLSSASQARPPSFVPSISFRQGRDGAKPPPLVPPALPSITVATARILLYHRPNHRPPPRDSPDGQRSPRPPARGVPVLTTRLPTSSLSLPLP